MLFTAMASCLWNFPRNSFDFLITHTNTRTHTHTHKYIYIYIYIYII